MIHCKLNLLQLGLSLQKLDNSCKNTQILCKFFVRSKYKSKLFFPGDLWLWFFKSIRLSHSSSLSAIWPKFSLKDTFSKWQVVSWPPILSACFILESFQLCFPRQLEKILTVGQNFQGIYSERKYISALPVKPSRTRYFMKMQNPSNWTDEIQCRK